MCVCVCALYVVYTVGKRRCRNLSSAVCNASARKLHGAQQQRDTRRESKREIKAERDSDHERVHSWGSVSPAPSHISVLCSCLFCLVFVFAWRIHGNLAEHSFHYPHHHNSSEQKCLVRPTSFVWHENISESLRACAECVPHLCVIVKDEELSTIRAMHA